MNENQKQAPKNKIKQMVEFLYRYAIEKGIEEAFENLPGGKLALQLWEIGNGIYEIMNAIPEQERREMLTEVHRLNDKEMEKDIEQIIHHQYILNPNHLSDDEKKTLVTGIYQSLKSIPIQNPKPFDVMKGIDKSLYGNQKVFTQSTMRRSDQGLGRAIATAILNGSNTQQQRAQFYRTPQSPPKLPNFEITGILGEGTFATVYLAKQTLDNQKHRICALKVGLLYNQNAFKNEVANMKEVQHENVLTCFDSGRFVENHQEKFWIAMPNTSGITLQNLINHGGLDLEQKLSILSQIADGLEALHKKKIIHQDLKPANCLISGDYKVLIGDLGLSKQAIDRALKESTYQKDPIGTAYYMSPDQVAGKNISFDSDLWAFGMMAIEILTGIHPWQGQGFGTVMANIIYVDVDTKNLSALPISAPLIEMLQTCINRDKRKRYKNAIEFNAAFNPLVKKEMIAIRHNKYRDSWRIILEKKMIENFILTQIFKRSDDFSLDSFLSQTKTDHPIAIDDVRMTDILNQISKKAHQLKIRELIKSYLPPEQILEKKEEANKKREQDLKQVDIDLEKEVIYYTPSEIVNNLSRLDKKRIDQKNNLENVYKAYIKQLDEQAIEIQKQWTQLSDTLNKELESILYHELTEYHKALVKRDIIKNKRWTIKKYFILIALISGLSLSYKNELNTCFESRLEICQPLQPILNQINTAVDDIKAQIPSFNSTKTELPSIHYIKLNGTSQFERRLKGSVKQFSVSDFYLSQTEITNEQYLSCVNAGVCTKPHWDDQSCITNGFMNAQYQEANKPVVCVDWQQARTFAQWVGGDLPSETQWEYAASSQGKKAYPWGNEAVSCQYAVIHEEISNCGTRVSFDVCQKSNGNTEQGLCDMIGNVWEWLLDDWYLSLDELFQNEQAKCEQGDCQNMNHQKIYKGGSLFTQPFYFNELIRNRIVGTSKYIDIGFRVAKK